MAYRDATKNRTYQRNWQRRKKAGLPTATGKAVKIRKQSKKTRLIKERNRSVKARKRKREFLMKEIGECCYICKRKYSDGHNIVIHTKSGKEGTHPSFSNLSWNEIKNMISHKEEYVSLCYGCHKGIHWCMKYLRMTWSEIVGSLAESGNALVCKTSEYPFKSDESLEASI